VNGLRWHGTKRRYRRFGIELDGGPDDLVWHFSFGSNMNTAVLAGRRGVRPMEWRVGKLDGYRLRFNLHGRPRGRSAPANIEPHADGTVWGVLYRMTLADMLRIDATEGIPNHGRYRHERVTVADPNENPIEAITYMAPGNEHDGAPSLRYITLLRDGARAHALPDHYIRYLDAVRHAQ